MTQETLNENDRKENTTSPTVPAGAGEPAAGSDNTATGNKNLANSKGLLSLLPGGLAANLKTQAQSPADVQASGAQQRSAQSPADKVPGEGDTGAVPPGGQATFIGNHPEDTRSGGGYLDDQPGTGDNPGSGGGGAATAIVRLTPAERQERQKKLWLASFRNNGPAGFVPWIGDLYGSFRGVEEEERRGIYQLTDDQIGAINAGLDLVKDELGASDIDIIRYAMEILDKYSVWIGMAAVILPILWGYHQNTEAALAKNDPKLIDKGAAAA